ncbi:MAG TPA: hypothetical protein PLX84_10905 [Acidiphilium sp.]|nr:hypothetical protein [Acidiphilium sp.]
MDGLQVVERLAGAPDRALCDIERETRDAIEFLHGGMCHPGGQIAGEISRGLCQSRAQLIDFGGIEGGTCCFPCCHDCNPMGRQGNGSRRGIGIRPNPSRPRTIARSGGSPAAARARALASGPMRPMRVCRRGAGAEPFMSIVGLRDAEIIHLCTLKR